MIYYEVGVLAIPSQMAIFLKYPMKRKIGLNEGGGGGGGAQTKYLWVNHRSR